jgi:transcriptional regulator PpsR
MRIRRSAAVTPIANDPPDLSELSAWAPELAKTFVALASDIALVIDGDGVIRAVEQGHAEPIAPSASSWIGQAWIDTVSGDTRGKVAKLLQEAASQGVARRREVNHALQPGVNLPVAYTAIRLGENGPVLAVGRDMRAIAAIQQRFIETQQDMERGYWNARQSEAQYRVLFQVATDAVIVVDPETLLILEANPAATKLFSSAGDQLVGKTATVGFAHASRGAVNELLATARSSGQSGEIRARLLGTVATTSVVATSFRADDAMRLLVRVRAAEAVADRRDIGRATPTSASDSSDAVVVTDSSGRILLANAAFLAMLHIASEADARGRSLAEWLGASDHPLASAITQVRRQGVVRRFASTAKPTGRAPQAVDVSGALMTEGDQECIGFTIQPSVCGAEGAVDLPRALQEGIEFLAGQVGDLALSTLLGEVAALAERHFAELALRRVDGNIDAAALLLGVERDRLVRAVAPEAFAASARLTSKADTGAS